MQAVSQAWKDNQAQHLVGESFVELLYEVGDPDSLADATISDNGAVPFSNTALTVNEIDETMTRYAMFEQNLWGLDGSFRILPESAPYTGTGFVSNNICNAAGLFSQNPTLTITFSRVHTRAIPGITIRWGAVYGDYADTFRVVVFNGAAVVATIDVAGNVETISSLLQPISNYNRITIEIIKWGNPLRRARVEEVFVGIKRVFGKTDLVGYQHTARVDLLSAELPKNELKFEIGNLNGEYNPLNPDGFNQYLLERQRIIAKHGFMINGNIEWIRAGVSYLSEWSTPQNGITATFTARDLLGLMQSKYAATVTNTSLHDLAVTVLTLANLPHNRDGSVKWVLHPSLATIMVDSAELDHTLAEVLQMIANAGRCVIYQDRHDRLRIEPLVFSANDYVVNTMNSYRASELIMTKKLRSVNVNKGMAVVQNEPEGEEQLVDNPLVSAAQANAVALWVRDVLSHRNIFKGSFRADPRLDALDRISVVNQFGSSLVAVTEIVYNYNGAFKGSYEGRAIP